MRTVRSDLKENLKMTSVMDTGNTGMRTGTSGARDISKKAEEVALARPITITDNYT